MDPIKLIEKDLGPEQLELARSCWEPPLVQAEPTSPFAGYKLYHVRGSTGQFDFPMLPHCSYCLYAANGRHAIRLTRAGKEIERILAEEWSNLTRADAVELASVILQFYDGGIKASHEVVHDLQGLLRTRQESAFDQNELARVRDRLGCTSCSVQGTEFVLRVITLMGWMHAKQNLGIEMVRVASSGKVSLEEREVLSTHIFRSVPQIYY